MTTNDLNDYYLYMFHYNRWNQYQIKIEDPINENKLDVKRKYDHELKTIIKLIKPHDILNIFGENPLEYSHCHDLLKYMKHKKIVTKIWMNQWIKDFNQDDLNYLVDELVIWCPAIIRDDFNLVSGRDFFDDYKTVVSRLKINKTLSFTVRPMSIEDLPEFYEIVIDTQSKGLILFVKSEFSKEELNFIKRFKRVKHMQIMEINNFESYSCQSIPNTIGTLKFEYQDWIFKIKESIRKIPVIKHTI